MDSRNFVTTSKVIEIEWYSVMDLLSDTGGFSKTISLLFMVIIGRALSNALTKQLLNLDQEHEVIFSYESILRLNKEVKQLKAAQEEAEEQIDSETEQKL